MTIDAHVDTPWKITKTYPMDLRFKQEGAVGIDLDFPRMKKGGLDSAIFALYLSEDMQDELGEVKSAKLIDDQYTWLMQQKGASIVKNTKEVLEVFKDGLVPMFIALEGGRLLHGSLQRLERFSKLGIKYLTVTHNRNTTWADSATDNPYHEGLTTFGKTVIKKAEELGVLIDVSHTSDLTCEAILDMSERPVIASHSGCRALLDHPRNLSDRLIRRISSTGGVIHVPFARRFIGPSINRITEHIDHIVQLAGIYSVGIGSDLDGAVLAHGIKDVSQWSEVCKESLEKRGYGSTSIEAITGGNTFRLLGDL